MSKEPTDPPSARTTVQAVAAFVWLPCLVGAFVFYGVVTWVPEAYRVRDALSAALLVAGIGAAIVRLAGDSRIVRVCAGSIMWIGLAGVILVWLWNPGR